MKKLAALLLSTVLCGGIVADEPKSGPTAAVVLPAQAEQVPVGLDEISLRFESEVRMTSFVLVSVDEKSDATDADLDLDTQTPVEPSARLPRGFITALEVKFEDLEPGSYAYRWTAVAHNGELLTGRGHFSVVADL